MDWHRHSIVVSNCILDDCNQGSAKPRLVCAQNWVANIRSSWKQRRIVQKGKNRFDHANVDIGASHGRSGVLDRDGPNQSLTGSA